MTKTETAPGIGTPEAAVQSCVSLIACVTGQPEELTARYLDLYYQTRLNAETAAEYNKLRDIWPEGLRPEYFRPPAVGSESETGKEPEPPSTAEAVPLPQSPQAAGGGKGLPKKPEAKVGPSETRKKVDFDEVLASASAGAKLPSKPKNAPYGKIKAEIRDRFINLRAQGMTIAQTVNLSGGKVTDGQILNIMNGSKVGMDAYNAIEDAMNKWEATVKAAGQADSTTE